MEFGDFLVIFMDFDGTSSFSSGTCGSYRVIPGYITIGKWPMVL